MTLGLDSDLGRRAAKRLREEEVIWLVTVGRDGTPQPSPVWFLWNEGEGAGNSGSGGGWLLVFSQPKAPKVRNITARPHVALHFDSDGDGGDIVVLTGTAEVLDVHPDAAVLATYIEKYGAGIAKLEMTPEQMLAEYSTALRLTPTRLRGF